LIPNTRFIPNDYNGRRNPRLSIALLSLLTFSRKQHLHLIRTGATPPIRLRNRPAHNSRNDSKPLIREIANANRPGNTSKARNDTNSPLCSVDTTRLDRKRTSTDEDDGNLERDDEENDTDEEPVAKHAFEHVELVVETAVVEDVKDLHPDKCVEDDGIKFKLFVWVGEVVVQDRAAGEVQDEDDGELVDILAHYLFPHCRCDEGPFALRWAIENLLCGRVGGECERGKGIHDEVYPKELYGFECGLHVGVITGCYEGEDHGSDVYCNLELSLSTRDRNVLERGCHDLLAGISGQRR
jgi:hypothetical protein